MGPSPMTLEKIKQNKIGNIYPNIARFYLRISNDEHDQIRQEKIIENIRMAGYYIAAIYREKPSGPSPDRPELGRMISDLQPRELVVAEKMNRLSNLPLGEADRLVQAIRQCRVRLVIPGLVDLSEVPLETDDVIYGDLEVKQEMLLRLALQTARENYEEMKARQKQGIEQAKATGRYRGRKPNHEVHERIIALREAGNSILETARLIGCSPSHVKKIWLEYASAASLETA